MLVKGYSTDLQKMKVWDLTLGAVMTDNNTTIYLQVAERVTLKCPHRKKKKKGTYVTGYRCSNTVGGITSQSVSGSDQQLHT